MLISFRRLSEPKSRRKWQKFADSTVLSGLEEPEPSICLLMWGIKSLKDLLKKPYETNVLTWVWTSSFSCREVASVLCSEFWVLCSEFCVRCSVFSVLCSLFCVLCLAGGGGQRSDLLPAASVMNPHCVYWFDLTLCSVKWPLDTNSSQDVSALPKLSKCWWMRNNRKLHAHERSSREDATVTEQAAGSEAVRTLSK